jgi:hypothetical protein
MILLRCLRCPPHPICPCNGSFFCFEEVFAITSCFLISFGGVTMLQQMICPALLRRGPSLEGRTRLGWALSFSIYRETADASTVSYFHYMISLRLHILSFTFLSLVASASKSPSKVPGHHRQAFIAYVRADVLISSICATMIA